jgi:Flp pilus assembly pilin Flp
MLALATAAGLLKNERGVEVVEYAVMVAIIVGGTIIALGALLAALISQSQDLIQVLSGG